MFDIFRELIEGNPLWVEAHHNLQDAHKRLTELSLTKPGKYEIYDAGHGRFVVPFIENKK